MTATTPGESFVPRPNPPERWSMSFMRAAQGCMRRAHLDRKAKVPADGDALVGSLWHECAASIGFVASMHNAERVEPWEARRIARRVLTHPERPGPMPREAHREVLDLIDRWVRSPAGRFRPGEVFEVLSTRSLNGRVLSAKLDRVWRHDQISEIRDSKTGWADVGSRLTLQGEVYAWHEYERDPTLELVVYQEDHVRAGVPNGPYAISRDDVYGPGGIEEFLGDAITRLEEAYRRGELPVGPGSACSSPTRCPHAGSCPAPAWSRVSTSVASEVEAERVFGSLLAQEALRDQDTKRLRGWLAHTGQRALQLGGEEIGMADKPGTQLDKRRLAADLAAGIPVRDLDEYVKVTNPSFGRRKAR